MNYRPVTLERRRDDIFANIAFLDRLADRPCCNYNLQSPNLAGKQRVQRRYLTNEFSDYVQLKPPCYLCRNLITVIIVAI